MNFVFETEDTLGAIGEQLYPLYWSLSVNDLIEAELRSCLNCL